MIAFLLISFFVFLAAGVPIAFSLGLSALGGLVFFMDVPMTVLAQRIFVSMDAFALLAIPFFMFAGSLMGGSGISKRLIRFAFALVGSIPGGLANVAVLSCMIFAGISGAAVADTAAVGGVLIPSMIEKKYPKAFTAALIGMGSTIGIIIPPSIPMVVMGGMLNISVGKLFLAGIIPGILIGLALMVIAYFMAKKTGFERDDHEFSGTDLWNSFKDALLALLLPIIIVGSIVGGIVSPTEAGAVAVVYAIFIGTFIYKELTLEKIIASLKESVLSSAKIYLIIGTAGFFTWLLTVQGFPIIVGNLLLSITTSPTVLMLIVIAILLVVTTFMESLATMVLLLPVLYPITQKVGVDPIVFGLMVVISVGIGLVTPPVGLCLYVSSSMAGVSLGSAGRAVIPFILSMLAIQLSLLAFPEVVLFLPNLLMK